MFTCQCAIDFCQQHCYYKIIIPSAAPCPDTFCKLLIVQQVNPAINPGWIEGYQMSLPGIARFNKQKPLTYFPFVWKKEKWFVTMGSMCGGTSGLCNRQFFDNQFVLLVLLVHTQLTGQLLLLRINSGVSNRPETCTRTSEFRHVGHHLVSVYAMICN